MSATERMSQALDRTHLEQLWSMAHAQSIRAQLAYDALAREDGEDTRQLRAAWLGLWHAQERERALAAALDQV
jgi:hypothetical protein